MLGPGIHLNFLIHPPWLHLQDFARALTTMCGALQVSQPQTSTEIK